MRPRSVFKEALRSVSSYSSTAGQKVTLTKKRKERKKATMSRIINLCLLLAVVVCFCNAQLHSSKQQCLCRSVTNSLSKESPVKSLQLFQATNFCNKVEIVVTMENDERYCLNPKSNVFKKKLSFLLNKRSKGVFTLTKSGASSTTAAF
ncbi:C-X-C motif chemokine 10-like [Gouania willdenowi]|uniref:C-X-C motif chemokine 10-like n=1 Tax=Gouania willdenowi TaxID=441366 RepID=A0A8C5E0V4_GOUWI|nr:C-X-C motif chemokine 10-like [Gouania willdenowi]